MSIPKALGLHVLLLLAVLILSECTDIDLRVQDQFYCFPSGRWLIDEHEPVGEWLFYHGPKVLLVCFGAACWIGYGASFRSPRFRAHRAACLRMGLAMVLVPLTVAGLKQVTNVYTPKQTRRYGRDKPYVKVLEKYPPGFRARHRGKGFPGGHASGGFALMMLYPACRRRRWKVLGLAGGLGLGWLMGAYQTLSGQHYLSHTIVSMQVGWLVILMILLARRRGGLVRPELRHGPRWRPSSS